MWKELGAKMMTAPPRPPASWSLPVRVGSGNLPLNSSEKRLPSVFFFSWRFKRALWGNGLPWPTRLYVTRGVLAEAGNTPAWPLPSHPSICAARGTVVLHNVSVHSLGAIGLLSTYSFYNFLLSAY